MDVVTLYNIALGKVGTRTTVSATSEGSNESNSCNTFYESTLKAVLRAARWNFARKQKLLTQLKSSLEVPNTCPSPWSYEYAYPSDCLLARYIMPKVSVSEASGIPFDSTSGSVVQTIALGVVVPYIISLDENSSGNDVKVILTNQYQAELVYTPYVDDPNLYDDLFVEALTSTLAVKIGRNLTNDKELIGDLKMEALNYVNQARAQNGNEVPTVHNPTPDWMRIRGVAGDFSSGMGALMDFDQIFQVQ